MKKLLITLFAMFAIINPLFSEAKEYVPHKYTAVNAAHILVGTKREAQLLKQMIDNGEDFAVLARQYSQCPSKSYGGNLGYFKRNQMVKEFETAAFGLPIGEISEPIQTQFGWHLIKVYDKK